jgi:chromosome segregation ATPase
MDKIRNLVTVYSGGMTLDKLNEWIQADLAENAPLSSICDTELEVPPDIDRVRPLIPKYRPEGKTKNYRKCGVRKEGSYILESKIEEIARMIVQRDGLRGKIEAKRRAINKLQASNAETQREIIETKRFFEKLRTEIEDRKLEHLHQLELAQQVERRERMEANRSKRAQAEISQKRKALNDQLERATKAFSDLEKEFGEFKETRTKEKKQLATTLKNLKSENVELEAELREIERQMAAFS